MAEKVLSLTVVGSRDKELSIDRLAVIRDKLKKESREIIGRIGHLLREVEETKVGGPETLARMEKCSIELEYKQREWQAWYDAAVGRMEEIIDDLSKTAKVEGLNRIKEHRKIAKNKCEDFRTLEAQRLAEINRKKEEEIRKENERKAEEARKIEEENRRRIREADEENRRREAEARRIEDENQRKIRDADRENERRKREADRRDRDFKPVVPKLKEVEVTPVIPKLVEVKEDPSIPKLKEAAQTVERKGMDIHYSTHREVVVIDEDKIDEEFWKLDMVGLRKKALENDDLGKKTPGVEVVKRKVQNIRSNQPVGTGRLF